MRASPSLPGPSLARHRDRRSVADHRQLLHRDRSHRHHQYEVDKESGHLKLDRPQKFSNFCPAPYGFLPSTYCGTQVAAFAMEKTGRTGVVGDGDPSTSAC